MISTIIQALFFIFPAGIANMFPVLCRKLNLPGSIPINEKKFGKNKTRKGLYCGVIGAILTLVLQVYFINDFLPTSQFSESSIALITYNWSMILPWGVLFGLSALLGDLGESYIKRRKGFAPGKARFPRDQLDWVMATIVFSAPFFVLPWQHVVTLLILTPLLHALTNIIGYLLGLKDVRW